MYDDEELHEGSCTIYTNGGHGTDPNGVRKRTENVILTFSVNIIILSLKVISEGNVILVYDCGRINIVSI